MSDMLVPLYKLQDPSGLLQELENNNIVIRRAIAPEKHNVVSWVRKHFSEFWVSECEVAFAHVPAGIFIALENGELIGFGCYDATSRGFFGPTGVSEQARGKGAGKGLLLACLDAMRREGYGYAVIGGAGPKAFYEKTVGAIEIPDSVPGIYKGMLK